MSKTAQIFDNPQQLYRFLWAALCVVCIIMMGVMHPGQAHAQVNSPLFMGNFSCTNGVANGNIFTADTIVTSADGVTLTSGATATDPSLATDPCSNASLGVFGRLMCFFKSTVGQIMSGMYCSYQYALQGPLKAALTLFILIFGVGVATGIMQFTYKDAFVALCKIALIWAFAANAEWGIGVGYRFFMLVAEQGSALVMGTVKSISQCHDVNGNLVTCATPSLDEPDSLFTSLFNTSANPNTSAGGQTIAGQSLPYLTPLCALDLGLLLVLLLIFMPIIIIFFIIMVIMYLLLYAQALLGYLTALVLISFLFILSPLFLSFALFRTTMPLFQQWLKYLTTFSLQMIIIFGFLAMLQMIPLGAFFMGLLGMIREYDATISAWFITIPIHTCSFCAYTIYNGAAGAAIACNSQLPTGTTAATLPPGVVPALDANGNPTGDTVIPLLNLLFAHDLIQFIVSQVIALWLIGHVMEDFLKKAPQLAQQLGGVPFAAALGGGSTPEGVKIGTLGLESIQAGLLNMRNQLLHGRNSHTGEIDPDSNKIGSGVWKGAWNPMARIPWKNRFKGIGGAFVDGVLHGASDMDDPNVQKHQTEHNIAKRRVEAVQNRLAAAQAHAGQTNQYMQQAAGALAANNNSATQKAYKEALGAYQRAEDSVDGHMRRLDIESTREANLRQNLTNLRGILPTKEHLGSLLDGISANAKDDEINSLMAEKRQERMEIDAYGRPQPKGHDAQEYYFLKMPEDVPAHEKVAVGRISGTDADGNHVPAAGLKAIAESRIMSLKNQLSASSQVLPAAKIQELEMAVANIQSTLQTAHSEESVEALITKLNNLQTSLL